MGGGQLPRRGRRIRFDQLADHFRGDGVLGTILLEDKQRLSEQRLGVVLLVTKREIEALRRLIVLTPSPIEGSQRRVDAGIVRGERLCGLQALPGVLQIAGVHLDQRQRQVHQGALSVFRIEAADPLLEIVQPLGVLSGVVLVQRIRRVEVRADLSAALAGLEMLFGELSRLVASAVLAPADHVGVGEVAVCRGGARVELQHLVRGDRRALVGLVAVVAQLLGGGGQVLLDLPVALRLPTAPEKVAASGERNREQQNDRHRPSHRRHSGGRPQSVGGGLFFQDRSRRADPFAAARFLGAAGAIGAALCRCRWGSAGARRRGRRKSRGALLGRRSSRDACGCLNRGEHRRGGARRLHLPVAHHRERLVILGIELVGLEEIRPAGFQLAQLELQLRGDAQGDLVGRSNLNRSQGFFERLSILALLLIDAREQKPRLGDVRMCFDPLLGDDHRLHEAADREVGFGQWPVRIGGWIGGKGVLQLRELARAQRLNRGVGHRGGETSFIASGPKASQMRHR